MIVVIWISAAAHQLYSEIDTFFRLYHFAKPKFLLYYSYSYRDMYTIRPIFLKPEE